MSDVSMEEDIKQDIITIPEKMWNVVFLNDDVTPMQYVIEVLMQLYGHDYDSAQEIMMTIHHSGSGVAGTFTHDVAESKCSNTLAHSRSYGYSLQVEIRKE